MSLIHVRNLKKSHLSGDEHVEALRGVDISISEGEFITIMGQSGSGKSTLLSVLGGMNHPSSGDVEIAGQQIYQLSSEGLADFRSTTLGFVFQSFHLLPYLNSIENVMLPLAINKMKGSDKKEIALNSLKRVGLAEKADRLPCQLSGGEQERIAIARAIVNRPKIILADEPTGNLDSVSSKEVMSLFTELNKAGQTVIVVTHNPENCNYSHRTIHLKDGMLL